MRNQTQAGDFGKGSSLRRLDELIAEAEKLADERRMTMTGELEELKNQARYCLADLGVHAEDALHEVSKLTFAASASGPLSGEKQSEHYANLRQLIGCLERVRESLQSKLLSAKRPVLAFPAPANAQWEDVFIRILSDHRVELIVGDIRETRNYAEMGFEDRRSEKPILAWGCLLKFGERGGTLSPDGDSGTPRRDLEKRIQEIRSRLRSIFGIERDPFDLFDRNRGYTARFRIGCAESYKT